MSRALATTALVMCAAGLLACGATSRERPVATAARASAARSSRIAIVVMENKEVGQVLGAPGSRYVTALARRYGVAARSYAVAHPSLPNYLALTSGSTHGIATDCTDCSVAGPNLVDRLQAAHIAWKAYMEALPAPCSQVAGAGRYAKKHDPFLYYDDVAGNPRRCRNVVAMTQLTTDLRRAALPTFSFISPDLCDDTHDCPVATGDRFLARLVPRLLRGLGPHGFLVLTWDEGATNAGCCVDAHGGHIATIVAGPDVRRHARSARAIDHYGVLRTIEDALRLAPLGASALRRSGTLDGLFSRRPVIRTARRSA